MKRRRKHKKIENDRLNDLPDCVFLHMLSFLNAKHAVQTCILSTRWNHIWKCLPILKLTASHFWTVKGFTKFVSRILSLRDGSTALHNLDFHGIGLIEPHLLKRMVLSLVPDLLKIKLPSLCNLKSLKVKMKPLSIGISNAKVEQAAVKSLKEAAMLEEAFKEGLEQSSSIPDGIVAFLLQNSPSTKVDIIED